VVELLCAFVAVTYSLTVIETECKYNENGNYFKNGKLSET